GGDGQDPGVGAGAQAGEETLGRKDVSPRFFIDTFHSKIRAYVIDLQRFIINGDTAERVHNFHHAL
ncbi:MAG TPA: hypothetical protein PLH54_11840, partial [Syntrophales bacterium]|nr:hypothetical protein [Syntrophales bacterium]HPC33556.1 hypothetical protein [Syntrophales bacterium]HRU89524.1 hypothetical protein [Syntrophales bacterium]